MLTKSLRRKIRKQTRRERSRKPTRRRLSLEALEDRVVLTGTPIFTMEFLPDTIGPGSVSMLQYTIDNSGHAGIVEDLAFTNDFPAPITIAEVADVTFNNIINPVFTAVPGSGTFTLSDADIGASAIGTITLNVTAATPGVHMNTTGDLTSTQGNSGTATDDLTVDSSLPGFSIDFGPDPIPLGGRTTLTYTIDNSANASNVLNLDFTDTLPTGLVIAGPANATTNVGTATIPPTLTAVAGSNVITLDANGTEGFPAIPAGAIRTVQVDVIATSTGVLENTTAELLAEFVTAGKAAATLEVTQPADIHAIMSFTDDPVPPGGNVIAEIEFQNFDRFDPATAIAFSVDLDAELAGLTFDSLLSNNVGGTVTGVGTTTLGLTGGTLPTSGSGTIRASLSVPGGTSPGEFDFPTTTLTADIGGSPIVGAPTIDTLFVEEIPLLTFEFLEVGTLNSDPVVQPGDDVVLRYTIANTSDSSAATDITFIDELTDGGPGTGFLPFPVNVTLPPVPDPPLGGGSSVALVFVDTDRQGLELTDGSLDPMGGAMPSGSYDVTLTLPATLPPGTYLNTTEEIFATVGGETVIGPAASDTLDVIAAPDLTISFTDPVAPGDTTDLEFTLTNSLGNPADATDIEFTLDLNAVIAGLSATGLPDTFAGGTITGTTNLSFTGGTLAPGESDSLIVSVDVPGSATPGSFTATINDLTATVSGQPVTGNPASDNLDIVLLTFEHEFTDPVVAGQTTELTYTITNLSPTLTATLDSTAFQHDLDAIITGLEATGPPTTNDPGGTLTGTDLLTYQNGSVAPLTTAEIIVPVLIPPGAAVDDYVSVTSSLFFDQSGAMTSDPSVDELNVVDAVTISKTFLPDTVAPGDTTVLEYTIVNNLPDFTLSDINFTDNLDAVISGLMATGSNFTQGTFTVDVETDPSEISVTGGTLAEMGMAGDTVTFQVPIQVPDPTAEGTFLSTTSNIMGDVDDTTPVAFSSPPAFDSLTVADNPDFGDAPNSYQTNLASGGPRHLSGGPRLGDLRDGEPDAETPPDGTGDDTNNLADEDAVAALDALLITDTTYSVELSVFNTTGGDASLVGWIDFDRSGTFDVDEAATATVANNDTTATLTWNDLGGAGPDVVVGPSFARFRLTTDLITAADVGGEASDGEVEDHQILICSGLTVTNTNDSGAGSLRDAIICANNSPGVDTIDFNIPGAGPHTITLLSALPTITDAVIIDGTTEPDFAGTPVVEIDGSSAGAGVNGLQVTAGGSTVQGLVINRFAASGIWLNGGTGNTVQGNFLGTNVAGDSALGNGQTGLRISGASTSNTIGGTTAAARNVISGNSQQGVLIIGSGASGNVVQGNFIGTNAAGSAAVANGSPGVRINQAPNNTVGGTATGAGNLISGNAGDGVRVVGTSATGNQIEGNNIGTNSGGTSALPNAHGVAIIGAPANTVGGNTVAARNVISGNNNQGIEISGATGGGNFVQGNFIGTDESGGAALANRTAGVRILNATGTTVGGTTESVRNVISGNLQQGVLIIGTGSSGNMVQGNFIGTNAAGSAAVANGAPGVRINQSPNNTIGGTATGAGNLISGNVGDGVRIVGTSATGNLIEGNTIGTDINGTAAVRNTHGVAIVGASGNNVGGTAANAANLITLNRADGVNVTGNGVNNAIQRNSIFSNVDLGIDLGANGVTANDPDDPDAGANNLQNFPEIASAVLDGGGNIDITYSVPSVAPNSTFPLTVEFFLADADAQEGQTFLGSDNYAAPGVDIAGVPDGGASAGDQIVATATDANGNTSEFSANVAITNPPPLLAAGGPSTSTASAAALTSDELDAIVAAALNRLSASGASAADLAALSSVTFSIADLPGALLGLAGGNTITLDANAAGYGWFIDPTPLDDAEFTSDSDHYGAASQRIDLLTAVLHEMDHILGNGHTDAPNDLQNPELPTGTRRLPTGDELDALFGDSALLDEILA